jgi:hypothetical protein
MKSKPYTVIGLYADNQQPWMEHVSATTPKKAALKGIKVMVDKNEAEKDDLFVVDVIEGHHMGTLNNNSVVNKAGIEELQGD